ncbi:MAG: hypothetical protein FWE37_07390, partial [Spirochaetaceae bacterium]|nr:hypothetical protein [Spirochaetaceae bacterium]
LKGLTIISPHNDRINPTQLTEIDAIKTKLQGFLLNGSEEDNTDNPKDEDDKIDDEIADEDEIEEEDEEMNRRVQDRLILQTDERLVFQANERPTGVTRDDVIPRFGCNLRILQAIGEMLAHEYFTQQAANAENDGEIVPVEDRILKPQQIKDMFTKGTTANVQVWTSPTAFEWLPAIRANDCFIRDNDWVIAETMRVLNVPTSITRPRVRDDNMNSRFIRHEHTTRLLNGNEGTHFTLRDRTRGIYWDPDPAVNPETIDVKFRRFNTNRN